MLLVRANTAQPGATGQNRSSFPEPALQVFQVQHKMLPELLAVVADELKLPDLLHFRSASRWAGSMLFDIVTKQVVKKVRAFH